MKRKDGDTAVDQNGAPYRDKPGRAGCEILTIATQFKAPRIVTFHNGDYIDYQGPLKTGDYVQVVVGIVPHRGKAGQSTSVPGLYLNPLLICFVGAGEEIVSEGIAVNAAAALGDQAPQMPAYAVPQQPPAHAPMPQQQPPAHAPMPQQQPPAHAPMPQQQPPAHAPMPQQQPPAHAPMPQQQPPAHAPMPQQQPPAHAPMPGFAVGAPQPQPASVSVYQHVIDDEIKY